MTDECTCPKCEPVGEELDAQCNRDGCKGVIDIKPVGNCSCHINPPCGACTSAPLRCPECLWEGELIYD